MFSYEEGQAFDTWKTREPEERCEMNDEQMIVARSAISDAPVYKGDEVIFDGDCNAIFPDELEEFLISEVEKAKDNDVIELLNYFMGEHMPRKILEDYVKKFIKQYTIQKRNQELLDIFGLSKGAVN